MDINIPPDTLGLYANATPRRENDGIAISEFNLTSPGSVPIVVRITPRRPSRVDVYLRRDDLPTTTDYDWSTRRRSGCYDVILLDKTS